MSRVNTTPSLDYIRAVYAPQDRLLESIDAALRAQGITMQIGPEEGKLLQMLVCLHQSKNIVEIGTLAGYSTLWLARAVPPDGHVFTIEKRLENAQMAAHFTQQSEVKDRISLIHDDAKSALTGLIKHGPFDMIFIDADKISYNDYLDWAETHVRPYGLIVADNTLLKGSMGLESPPEGIAPATWENMRRFNARLADPEKYFSTMILTHDGMSVAMKLF